MVESNVALVEFIPCAALLYSGAGTILAANWMFCELVGYMPDELEHRRLADLIISDERQLDDGVWLTELGTKTGDAIQCEVARKCLNGSGPMRCLALMRKFAESATRDSEAKSRAEIDDSAEVREVLRDTQSRLEAALGAAGIGTWTWDIQPDQVYADSNLAAMFGMGPETANGGPIDDYFKLVHPEDIGAVRAGIERSVATGQPYHETFRLRATDGGTRYLHGRGVVATDADGRPVRMSGAVLDITRQHLAEDALRSSELTFRTLADNISQLAWMADADGYIFWYNNRWFEYTGTTLEQMRDWGWSGVHHPEHVGRVVKLFRKCIVEQQVEWEDTFPLRGADGQYRWFLSRAMPIRDEHGRVVRWLCTNTDITEQRAADTAAQLLRADGCNADKAVPVAEVVAGAVERHDGATRPLHILLVDRTDDGDGQLPAALEAEGHMVALCRDEPSALETARDLHPDAVLIRTDMPGVEGYALARQLRALHPDEHATYIALSDSDQPHDKVIARGAAFDHLLERPVAIGSLRRILA